MSDNSWMNHPALGGIDPEKLRMLSSLAEQAQGKSQADLLPFLMRMAGGGDPPGTPPGTPAGNSPQDVSPSDPNPEGEGKADFPSEATAGSSGAGTDSPGSVGMSFDPSETEAIIQVMKSGKSPQEIQKIDRILSIMKKIRR